MVQRLRYRRGLEVCMDPEAALGEECIVEMEDGRCGIGLGFIWNKSVDN